MSLTQYLESQEDQDMIRLLRSEERRVGKEILPSCKIHMVEEETLDGGLKGGGKK